jgi:ABC-type amino acid transport substrate-binding protein
MEKRIVVTAAAALALAAGCGTALAQPSALYRTAAAVIAPAPTADVGGRGEVIPPPANVDPDMAITPPQSGARMPIIAPPEVPGGRFGIER